MIRYCVDDAIGAGMIADAPVPFVTFKVMKPLVVDADAPTTSHPGPAVVGVEVANIAITTSPFLTPVTAQSIATDVEADTVNVEAISEQVPF